MNRNVKKAQRFTALIVLTIMVLTIVFAGAAYAQSTSFKDIGGHWAYNVISDWINQGLISGYPDGTFKPENKITRAEFAVLVNKSFRFEETESISFSDVKASDWFYSDIAKAKKAGYLEGYGDGTVKPNGYITREEAAKIVATLRALAEDSAEAGKFADASGFASWSKGFIGAVKKAGFMKGYDDGSFKPAKNITRSETVVTLNALFPLTAVKLDAISDQTIKIGATAKAAVKAAPTGAKLTVAVSDSKVATAELKGTDIELKGVAAGNVTVTISAIRLGFLKGTSTFKVAVESAPVATTGGSTTPSNPPPYTPPPATNSAPSISVVEPDGVNDGIITLTLGSTFAAPTVTAADAEDGNITSRIVKTGESAVNTKIAGDYQLKYSVTDNGGLTAQKSVTVKVVGIEATVNITVEVANGAAVLKNIKVNSTTVGTKFKVEGSGLISSVGQSIAVITTAKTRIVSILDANGLLLGTVTADVENAGTKDYKFTIQRLEAVNAKANITVTVAGGAASSFKEIKLNSLTLAAGTRFMVQGSSLVKNIGESIAVIASESTRVVYILDAAGNVLGTITADLSATNTKDYEFIAQIASATFATANIKVDVAEDVPSIKDIAVNSSTVGVSFKVEGSQLKKTFGQSIQVNTSAQNCQVYILDADDKIIGTVTVNVAADNTGDYVFQVAGSTEPVPNTPPVITVVEADGNNDGIINLKVGDTFVAPTVTASDVEDGDLTANIVKTGTVNTAAAGSYTLTYDVKDSQGLSAAQRTVVVNVAQNNPQPGNKTILVSVVFNPTLPMLKEVKVVSSDIGTKYKVDPSDATYQIGSVSYPWITGDTTTVHILNDSGVELGSVAINVSAVSSNVSYTLVLK